LTARTVSGSTGISIADMSPSSVPAIDIVAPGSPSIVSRNVRGSGTMLSTLTV